MLRSGSLSQKENKHQDLLFDKEDSWSLKYNIIWDKLLDIHIFDDEIFEKKINYIKKR